MCRTCRAPYFWHVIRIESVANGLINVPHCIMLDIGSEGLVYDTVRIHLLRPCTNRNTVYQFALVVLHFCIIALLLHMINFSSYRRIGKPKDRFKRWMCQKRITKNQWLGKTRGFAVCEKSCFIYGFIFYWLIPKVFEIFWISHKNTEQDIVQYIKEVNK